ncbi:MAG: tetratricopeptide repeat protein [bacterium]
MPPIRAGRQLSPWPARAGLLLALLLALPAPAWAGAAAPPPGKAPAKGKAKGKKKTKKARAEEQQVTPAGLPPAVRLPRAGQPFGSDKPRVGDLIQALPADTTPRKPLSPLLKGAKPSSEAAERNRRQCAQASYLVRQGNAFEDESGLTIKYYQQALTLCPGHAEGNFRLGVIRYNQKDVPAALKLFDLAVRRNPRFGDGYYNLGIIHRYM